MVYAPILRHLERVADCDRRGRLPAGARQGHERRANDPGQSEKDFDAIGDTPGRRLGRAVVPTHRPPTQSGQGDDACLNKDCNRVMAGAEWNL
jgi:hypothetical protein